MSSRIIELAVLITVGGVFWDEAKLREPRVRKKHRSKFDPDQFDGSRERTFGQMDRRT